MKVSIEGRLPDRTPFILAVAVLMAAALLTISRSVSSSDPQDADALRASDPPPNGIWVDSLDLNRIGPSWLRARAGKSVRNNPLSLNGVVYPHGIGSIAMSELTIDLKGEAVRSMVSSLMAIDPTPCG